jgi:hypothetical protein
METPGSRHGALEHPQLRLGSLEDDPAAAAAASYWRAVHALPQARRPNARAGTTHRRPPTGQYIMTRTENEMSRNVGEPQSLPWFLSRNRSGSPGGGRGSGELAVKLGSSPSAINSPCGASHAAIERGDCQLSGAIVSRAGRLSVERGDCQLSGAIVS